MFCKVRNCTGVITNHVLTNEPNIHQYYFDHSQYKDYTLGLVDWYYVGVAIPQLEERSVSSFLADNFESYKLYLFPDQSTRTS